MGDRVNFSEINVLIVDDTAFFRDQLKNTLIDIGFKRTSIIEADDGAKAIEILSEQDPTILPPFDIILSDWNMPLVDGIGLLKSIRKTQGYYQSIPFVLVTTVSEKDKVIEAIKLGLSGYIIKPISKIQLISTLQKALTK